MVSVSQVPALTTTHQVQSQSQPQAGTVVVQQTGANVIQSPAQRNDNAKEKCRKFLTNLIDLSKREPAQVEMNVKTLIQELVDANVGPEDFCKKLENLLNAAPQPCLVGFLKVRPRISSIFMKGQLLTLSALLYREVFHSSGSLW